VKPWRPWYRGVNRMALAVMAGSCPLDFGMAEALFGAMASEG